MPRRYDDPSDPLFDPGTSPAPRDAADAVMNDRVRVAAILDSEHGRRNPTMAREMALQRGMAAEDAISLLAMVPGTENPLAAADNPYRAALDRETNVSIGSPIGGTATDPNAKRLAELRQAGRQLSIDRGYRKEHA